MSTIVIKNISTTNMIDTRDGERRVYPLYIKTEQFNELLTIQIEPVKRIVFKGKEISMEELVKILEVK